MHEYRPKRYGHPSSHTFGKHPSQILLEHCTFNRRALFEQYAKDPFFRALVASNRYLYLDGYILVASRQCILATRSGKLAITTRFAPEPRKYCVSYRQKRNRKLSAAAIAETSSELSDSDYGEGTGSFGGDSRGGGATTSVRVGVGGKRRPPYCDLRRALEERSIADLDDAILALFTTEGLPDNFPDMLCYLMRRQKVSVEDLAERTGISERTIVRMRSPGESYPTLPLIVAVCLAMHLLPQESHRLINLAGYSLNNTKTSNAYKFFLNFQYNAGVEVCNDYMVKIGLPPMTSLSCTL